MTLKLPFRELHGLLDAQRNFEQLEQTLDPAGKINGVTVPLSGAAWVAPTLINGWANTGGAGVATAGYLKDPVGFVHLKGRIVGGANGTVAFVLPAGFLPGATDYYPLVIAGTVLSAAVIDAAGNVTITVAGGAADISMGGVSFLAEG